MAGKAAIVGAGIMGLSAARALSRRGWQVTIYEQFEVGTKRGSSHGRSRIFRLAYPDPKWVRMAQEALRGEPLSQNWQRELKPPFGFCD